MPRILQSSLGVSVAAVAVSHAKQEVREIIVGELPLKPVDPLRINLQRLQLAEVSPTAAKLQLMRSLAPGKVVSYLIVVGSVEPGIPVDVKVRASFALEINGRKRVVHAAEKPDLVYIPEPGKLARALAGAC